jgi:hypothetical protein
MKETVIKRSKNKGIAYLTLSLGILGFFVYQYIMEERIYQTGKSFYWPGILLFAILTVYFIYGLMDKSPMYVFNEKGVTRRGSLKIISWKELYYYESKVTTRKYINIKQVSLSDQNGKEIITIDLTHSDMTIEKLEQILKKKLKQKTRVIDN